MDTSSGEPSLQPITILIKFTSFERDGKEVEKEERHAGFLTGNHHAMYADEFGTLVLVGIIATDDPDVFVDGTGWTQLGNINDAGGDVEWIVKTLAIKLHNMSAYDFFVKVLAHVRDDFDYEGLILPKLIYEGSEFNENTRNR